MKASVACCRCGYNHEKYNQLQFDLKNTKTDTPTLLVMVKYRNKRTNRPLSISVTKNGTLQLPNNAPLDYFALSTECKYTSWDTFGSMYLIFIRL